MYHVEVWVNECVLTGNVCIGEREGGWERVELMIMYLFCVIATEREGGGVNIEVGHVVCAGRHSMFTKCVPSRTHVSYKV